MPKAPPDSLPTEDDLRTRILAPFLHSIGIGPSQIRLEKSFRLRLGRTAVEVASRDAREELRGRLDILVMNERGENLFVVEVKVAGANLSDQDRDQGISYARLLDRIAPFVVLTNGEETRVYDTVTKEEISGTDIGEKSAFWRNGCVLATADDIRIRFEALRAFVGYSEENVRAFSQAQQASRMEPLRGGSGDRAKKYIPELYLTRNEVHEAVSSFMAGPGTAFALVGDSGVGKTNEMCALAESLGRRHIVFFFSAGHLGSGLAETIKDEFNWTFSDQLGAPELVRRLADLASYAQCRVCILVDALDEAVVPAFAQSLSEFALHLRGFSGAVKLIVSAKTSAWEHFARFRGEPSSLSLALEAPVPEGPPTDVHNATPSREPFTLTRFSSTEMDQVAAKYRLFFDLPEEPQGRLRQHCQNPFVLRMTAEVYAGATAELPEDISEEELIRSLLKRKLAVMNDRNAASAALDAVGRAVYEHASSPRGENETMADRERVALQRVREVAGRAGEAAIDDLVHNGLLIPHADTEGRVRLSFYYSRMRDFVIARRVLSLDRMDVDQFRSTIDTLLSDHILESALFWHLRTASAVQRSVVGEVLHGRALSFVQTYQQILDEIMPGAKQSADPGTAGEIGIVYDVDDFGLRDYALHPISEDAAARVTHLQTVYDGHPHPFFRAAIRIGARGTRGGGVNFSNSDPLKAAADFALRELNDVLDNGGADETVRPAVIRESVIAIATARRKLLGIPEGTVHQMMMLGLPSIDVADVLMRIHAYRGKQYYRNQWMDDQIARSTNHVTRGSSGSVSITVDEEAVAPFERRGVDEAMQGKRFPRSRVIGEGDLDALASRCEFLLERGEDIIQGILPEPDLSPPFPDYRPHWAYSPAAMAGLLETFFMEGLKAYRAIAERTVPGLLHLLPRYFGRGITAVVVYDRPEGTERHAWGTVTYTLVPTSDSIRVEPYVDSSDPIFVIDRRAEHWCTAPVAGERRPVEGFSRTDLQRLLSPHSPPGYGTESTRSTASARLAPVRAFAYELLARDVKRLSTDDLVNVLEQ